MRVDLMSGARLGNRKAPEFNLKAPFPSTMAYYMSELNVEADDGACDLRHTARHEGWRQYQSAIAYNSQLTLAKEINHKCRE